MSETVTTMASSKSPDDPVDLDALDAFLMSDRAPEECMGLSDLDGFLTGIVVGPELIMPSEWLPVIWGREEPGFEHIEEARVVLGAITGRYNEIIRRLDSIPPTLDPVFWEGPERQVIVTDWAAGFLDAVMLRPDAWEPLMRHPEARILMMPILVLGAGDPDEVPFDLGKLPKDEVARLHEDGENVILQCVAAIHAFWKERRAGSHGARRPRRPNGAGRRKR